MLISKADILLFAQFTLNIENRLFNPSATDAQEYDLRPVIMDDMYNAILLIAPNGLSPWSVATNYAINDHIIFTNNKAYKALTANIGSQPDTNPLDWVESELGTFYYNFLRPFLAFCAHGRFMLWAGSNLTQYGFVKISEDTSTEISEDRRAELIADVKTKSNIWLSRLKKRLCKVNWIFDNVNYDVDLDDNYRKNPRKTFRIRPVGKNYTPYTKPTQGPVR